MATLKMAKIDVFITYPNRWSEGRIHLARNTGVKYSPMWEVGCMKYAYGKHEKRDRSEVNCKKCLRGDYYYG